MKPQKRKPRVIFKAVFLEKKITEEEKTALKEMAVKREFFRFVDNAVSLYTEIRDLANYCSKYSRMFGGGSSNSL